MRAPAAGLMARAALGGCAQAPEPSHAVLVVIDSLRADHLGSYGYPKPTSRHRPGSLG